MLDTRHFSRRLAVGLPAPLVHERSLRPILTPPKTTIVCHPVWKLAVGGLERQLVEVVNRLPRPAFRHLVVARGWDDSSARLADRLGDHVEVIRQISPSKEGSWSRRLAAILRQHDVRVLHVRGLSMLLDAVLAADLTGETAVACSFHGFESSDTRIGGIRRKLYREALLRCDARWAVSDAAAKAIARELNLAAASFEVLRNGVDAERFRPAADARAVRRSLDLPDDRPVLLAVGNLKPIKGHGVLLEALGRLGPRAKKITLVLLGEDYLDGRLQGRAEAVPDCDIRFVGPREDVLPWYQAADVFVLPSLWEGLSNALLEAMACGLSVVATRAGGTPELIDDGKTGLLAGPGDAEALAGAIARMLDGPGLRRALGAAARARVVERFSLDRTTREYARGYRQLAEPPAESPAPAAGRAGVEEAHARHVDTRRH